MSSTNAGTSPASRLDGRARQAAEEILDAFADPERLPAALAPIFIHRKDEVPCRRWSWSNQLLVALHGHSDARGYRQWQRAGRQVKEGEKSFIIFAPITKRTVDEESEEERTITVGFKGTPVFGYEQTEGEPLADRDQEVDRWLEELPLAEVARSWNLTVEAYNAEGTGVLGRYRRGRSIAVGVKNLSTWCHELVHAADDRAGNLTESAQHWRSETVAELGSAVLLKMIGYEQESDLGGCWQYIERYAEEADIQPITACRQVLRRTCQAVSLILDTADSPATRR